MIVNGKGLLEAAPIRGMIPQKEKLHGVSHGLSEVGYDLRIRQTVRFFPPDPFKLLEYFRIRNLHPARAKQAILRAFYGYTEVEHPSGEIVSTIGRTALASTIEVFEIPEHLWCEFRNKSTYARRFVDASIGTDGEPGWLGGLTLELIFHGNEPIVINAGSGIVKAVFHEIREPVRYLGKYQNQSEDPVPAILD